MAQSKGRIKRRAEQTARTKRNIQKRRLKFECRIKAQIEEAVRNRGKPDEEARHPVSEHVRRVYHKGYNGSHRGNLSHYESKAERLRAHLAWSIGMRKRWN